MGSCPPAVCTTGEGGVSLQERPPNDEAGPRVQFALEALPRVRAKGLNRGDADITVAALIRREFRLPATPTSKVEGDKVPELAEGLPTRVGVVQDNDLISDSACVGDRVLKLPPLAIHNQGTVVERWLRPCHVASLDGRCGLTSIGSRATRAIRATPQSGPRRRPSIRETLRGVQHNPELLQAPGGNPVPGQY